jgi:hypothetical protein
MVDPVLFVFGCLCYQISISSSKSDIYDKYAAEFGDSLGSERGPSVVG